MGFDFRFQLVEIRSEISRLIDFLRLQDLGYPNYSDWVERTRVEIADGHKKAVVALSNGILVGDLVFQQHKQLPWVREIKNLRVHPDLRSRGFARFMLRQVEVEEGDYSAIVVDARENQTALIALLKREGYMPLGCVNLYDDVKDVVMIKCPREKDSGFYRVKQFFTGD